MKVLLIILWLLTPFQLPCIAGAGTSNTLLPSSRLPLVPSKRKLFHRSRRLSPKQQQVDVQQGGDCIPPLLKPWVALYRLTPKKICLPFTDLDFTFTLVSAMFLTCLDYSMAYAISRQGNWPHKESRAFGGSIATICHSTFLVIGLFDCLRTERYSPSDPMDVHPHWWQDAATALMQFCTGYMLYDAVIQFIADRWVPGSGPVLSITDFMFLGHHAGTALYMTSARLIQAGHMSALSLMFLGEITAPIMNLLRITKTAVSLDSAPWLQALLPMIEKVFACFFVTFRVFIGPICAAHLTYDIVLTRQGRRNVPIQLSAVWMTMVWGVLIGAIPWIKNALDILGGTSGAPFAG